MVLPYHENVWDCLKQLHQLGEAIVAELALVAEVVMVGRNELAERHSTVRLMAEEVHYLLGKLLGSLHFLNSALW